MFRKHGYKMAAVAILLYVFIAGMLVPLKPGISSVTPQRADAGKSVTMEIKGYNTSFSSGEEEARAWLKLNDQHALIASSVEITSDREMNATFQLPQMFPVDSKVTDLALVVDHPTDGAIVLPSALVITQSTANREQALGQWPNAEITNLHERAGMTFPFRRILDETIRNTYFHVPMWFGMIILFAISMYHSWRHLSTQSILADMRAVAYAEVGVVFGILGLVTGALWAKYTWGSYWSFDIKQNMSAVAMLIYVAYFILRQSFEDEQKQARIGAVYNIFAFAALIPLLFVIPRMTASLHPGNGGNPGFGGEDLDNTMRMVFYPAIIGWTMLGIWISSLAVRKKRLEQYLNDPDLEW